MQTLTKQTLKIFWQHSRRYKATLFLVVTATLGVVGTEVYTPFIYKDLFNVLASANSDKYTQLIKTVWLLGLINLVGWAFRRTNEFANIKFQARTISDILNTCFEKMHGHSFSFFNNNFVGSLVRKVGRFGRSFEDIADEVVYRLGRTSLIVLGILIVLFFRNFLLGAALLVWTIIFLATNYWFSLYKIKFDIKRAEIDTKTTGQLADTITNHTNLKLFNSFEREFSTYKKLTNELYKIRKLSWDLSAKADAAQSALLTILEVGMMYLAVKLWQNGKITIGDFALIQGYLVQILMRIWDVGRFMRKIYENLADANEMTEIIVKPLETTDCPNAQKLSVKKGKIDFRQANFGYHQNLAVLKNFNLTISPGERVAFVGPSGGGKSTLVKLLFRFFDIDSGQILIDGQDISQVTQNSLRENLSLVPQEPILFHRSLMENIRYGKPGASDAEVVSAAKLAHAHEFISSFPDAYETFVGERGIKLSGGERQRVAIARAILKNAPILVLDEATSSLDSESEMLIQDALRGIMSAKSGSAFGGQAKTVIVIAHRLSTIMQMDRIVVIENGKILEQGKHRELLKIKEGLYQKLWEIQAGGFTS